MSNTIKMYRFSITKSFIKRMGFLFLLSCCLILLAGCKPLEEKKQNPLSLEEEPKIETEFSWDWEKIDGIRNATVYLYGQVPGYSSACTGVVWEMGQSLQILTVAHLLEHSHMETIQVTFWDGTYVETSEFQILENTDICVLSCDFSEIAEETKAGLYPVKRNPSAYTNLQQDDPVFLLGATPTGRTEMVGGKVGNLDWYVPEFDETMLYLYITAKAGMSGAGAFDKNGQYLGMLIGGGDSECACLPLEKIEEALLTFPGK